MKKNPRMWHTVNPVIFFFHLKTISTLQPYPFRQCDILPATLPWRMAKPGPMTAQKHLAAGSEEQHHKKQSKKRNASYWTNQYRAPCAGASPEYHTVK